MICHQRHRNEPKGMGAPCDPKRVRMYASPLASKCWDFIQNRTSHTFDIFWLCVKACICVVA
jgi:hypothetical protein